MDVLRRVAPSRDLVVPALACEQRPRAAARIGTAIVPLTVAVVVVAVPARTNGRVDLEDSINDTDRIHHDRIVCASDAVPHELEKPTVDDFLCRPFPGMARRNVAQAESRAVGVLGRCWIPHVHRQNAHVVAGDAGHERALRGHCPAINVLLQRVRVLLQEDRCLLVEALPGEAGRAHEGCNIGRQRRG